MPPEPGRATTSAPTKPTRTASQRLRLWRSPRYGRDSSTTKSGAVKYSATTSASGIAGNARKYVVYAIMNSRARITACRVPPSNAVRQPPIRRSSARKMGSATTERIATASITG